MDTTQTGAFVCPWVEFLIARAPDALTRYQVSVAMLMLIIGIINMQKCVFSLKEKVGSKNSSNSEV